MAKKTSGLGRGLGELLEDNAPEFRQGQGSVVRKTEAPTAPAGSTSTPVPKPQGYSNPSPQGLYDGKQHKNKSLKANFKNFNR